MPRTVAPCCRVGTACHCSSKIFKAACFCNESARAGRQGGVMTSVETSNAELAFTRVLSTRDKLLGADMTVFTEP